MEELSYNIVYDEEVLPSEIMDLIEQVTVEQEIDTASEARIRVPLLMDDQGNWRDINLQDFSTLPRIRIEIQIGENGLVALIDGHLISVDSPRGSNPGQSYMTMVVQDDTYLLDREQITETYDAQPPETLADEVFRECDTITNVQTDPSEPPTEDTPSRQITRRDTAIRFLQRLAGPIGFHAWVIPGENFGESIGCFRQAPVEDASVTLTPMTLTGRQKNITSFNVQDNSANAANYRASSVALSSESVESAESGASEEIQGDMPAVSEDHMAVRLSSPDDITAENQAVLAQSASDSSSYIYKVEGQTDLICYKSVLRPYFSIDVSGVGGSMSGSYLITKVVHEITKAAYRQSFTLGRNALSEASGSSSGLPGSEVA